MAYGLKKIAKLSLDNKYKEWGVFTSFTYAPSDT